MTRQKFTLDGRDRRIIALLITGTPTKEIAAAFGMKPANVPNILAQIRGRFDAASNEHLIALLFRRGILTLPAAAAPGLGSGDATAATPEIGGGLR